MSKSYNGHKNRAHWNVSLWINNDESLYNMALAEVRLCRRMGGGLDKAAINILDQLSQAGIASTPDGYRYNVTNIRAAIVGI